MPRWIEPQHRRTAPRQIHGETHTHKEHSKGAAPRCTLPFRNQICPNPSHEEGESSDTGNKNTHSTDGMSEKENGNVVFFVSTSFLPDKAEMGEAAVLCL